MSKNRFKMTKIKLKLRNVVVIAICLAGTVTIFAQEAGVNINGVIWATRNVDMPGTFAKTPGASGKYYQFGSAKPSLNNDNTVYLFPRWNNDTTMWHGKPGNWDLKKNNPCPAGWRLPTVDEFISLFESTPLNGDGTQGKWKVEFFDGEYVYGCWLGPNALQASPNKPGIAIFFPAIGGLSTGEKDYIVEGSYYWTAIYNEAGYTGCDFICMDGFAAHLLSIGSETSPYDKNYELTILSFLFGEGLPLRCVKK